MQITDFLESSHPNAPALCDPACGVQLSYGELQQSVEEVSQMLASAGLEQGDAVVIPSVNNAALVTYVLAIMQAGGVAVPVNPACTDDEIAYFCKDAEAKFLIESCSASAELIAMRSPNRKRAVPFVERTCLMIYTSGTTSKPKGVPLTHDNLLASVKAFAETFKLTYTDATLVPMPLFHVHGLVGATLSTFVTGGKVVLQPRFSASQFWRQIAEHKITWYTASPTVHRILLARAHEDDIPRGQLRFIRSSSASLGIDTLSQMEETFGSCVLEAYGMTEAANQISCNPLPPGQRKVGSVGIGAGVEFAVVDEAGANVATGNRGQVAIRGASVTHGYHAKPEANAATFRDGWLLTGDEGYVDDEGYLYIVGRIKELINRGGEKISPAEVEEVLLKHPLIKEAACFGAPDQTYGEQVQAAIVVAGPIDVEHVTRFCKERMSAIKVPVKIHLVESIPRTPTNKVQRQQLSELLNSPI